MKTKNQNKKQVVSKYDKIMEGLGIWTSFYRSNPERFAVEYLNMRWMKPFQKILLMMMFRFTYVMTIASRGMGKSMIVAAFCCCRCILYPSTKICIAAGQRGQSINVLNKIIEDFMPKSQNLHDEIDNWKTSPSDAYIIFKNGSTIKVSTAKDSARSARAHIVIFDEFRLIDKGILDKVLRKFKAGQRTPEFYNKPEYKDYPKEPNKEVYLSSAWYKYHWSWSKFKAFFKSMMKEESYFLCGFPYQLPVSAGYYPEEQIREEMSEDDFDSIGWSIEMDSLFFGSSENALYCFEDLNNVRKIKMPIYPRSLYSLLNDSKIKYVPKINGEIRLICMDIAYMGGTKNDATAIAILQLIPTNNNQYMRNLIYMTTIEGGHTFDQALAARRLYDDLDCDYLGIDTLGVGGGVYDNLVQEQWDDERNIMYPAWGCVNDEKMNDRCKDVNAPKVIYSIKASAEFNSNCAASLRDGIKRGKIRFLINEIDGSEILNKLKSFNNLKIEDQVLFEAPYIQTTALINEMVNLDYEMNGTKIKVKEASGMRKDRFSAASYAYMIANDLELELRTTDSDYDFVFSYS